MKSFKSQFTKDDKAFWKVIRDVLGRNEYEYLWSQAIDEFRSHTRPSEGKRKANLIGLQALTEIGVNWRDYLEGKSKPKPKREVKPTTDSGVKIKPSKYNGPSILDMADQNRLKK